MRSCFLLSCALVAALASTASADSIDVENVVDRFVELTANSVPGGGVPENVNPPRFAFTGTGVAVSPKDMDASATNMSDFAGAYAPTVVALSGDKKSAWITTDVEYSFPCGMEGCEKMISPRTHVSGLVDATNHAVAWHVGVVRLAAEKPPVKKRGKPIAPPAIKQGVDAGTEDVAKLFQTSMADPKALAKTVSDRKDAVLFGSELAERYASGAKIKATLLKWKLGFKVRDGVQAGLAPSKTTAWVAANVDAAKAGEKSATPYRAFAIYDKKGSDWQLVVLHFSTVTAEEKP